MKRFRYSLESLMRLNQARLDDELSKLEQITSGIAQVDRHRAELDQMNQDASRAAAGSSALQGWQLSSLHDFRRFVLQEGRRLASVRGKLADQLEDQRLKVVEAHKKVRILEVLKEKRFADWKIELDREQEQAVSDIVVARWAARQNK